MTEGMLDSAVTDRLLELESALVERAEDLALFLVYDRPERESERQGLWRTSFAERCMSDAALSVTIEAFRSVGAYVELFDGEREWIAALADQRLLRMPQPLKIAFNGIGWGIGHDGFMPGRKALVPLVADAYGVACTNADAHACAVSVHKFHSSLILDALGIHVPRTWHYRAPHGWVGDRPPTGTTVIAKSTYEAWSVGVTRDSVFVVDATLNDRVAAISESIGQAVTVQEFIAGREVYVPVWSCPESFATAPVQVVAKRAAGVPTTFTTIQDMLEPDSISFRLYEESARNLERLTTIATNVVQAFDLSGLARIDFRIDEQEQPWVFDIAVDPGTSSQSAVYTSVAHLGIEHSVFLRAMVAATLSARGKLAA